MILMFKPLRFGSALSALAAASIVGGCAAPQGGPRSASIFGGDIDKSNIGLATRAVAALAAEDFRKAVDLAERAVANSPKDAGFRALLGNAYFGSGRFGSAEAAYRDSLSLVSNQPQVVLKLALAQIAQGKAGEAVAFLEAARSALEASDYGLALALAGDPQRAVSVLDAAAREPGADSRLRQNLALAHGLSGDWVSARTVAEQDLAPNLVDARIQQWMALAKPARAYDQVAALTGVKPALSDAGQPVRLALRSSDTRLASVQAPAAAPPPQAPPVLAQAAVPFAPAASLPPAPAFMPDAVASDPLMSEMAPPPPPPPPVRAVAPRVKAPVVRAAAFVPTKRPAVRQASMPRSNGRSTAVVQLGAYGSPQRVAAAWAGASRRFASLRAYMPMSARFSSARGTVYRLSVKGFASAGEANSLCSSLRRSGASCFVRSVAGDAPVRIASR
jgi:Flp pilus assembly protein TadD